MKRALTIAGFDPSGGAGLQRDMKVFHALGVYGLSVVAALTAQNSRGVAAVHAVDSRFVQKQLDVLLADMLPDATKIGMLFGKENVRAVVSVISRYKLRNVVLDPVAVSSSGRLLMEDGAADIIRQKLLPLCSVITPNRHEASLLSGIDIRDETDMAKAAVVLKGFGPELVIITGGQGTGTAVDMVYDGSFAFLRGRRWSGEFHGTGCTFSSAIAALLAQGNDRMGSARKAKRFMARAFRKSFSTGGGMRLFAL